VSEDALEWLLDYDGYVFWLEGSDWSLRFRIHRAAISPGRPAGVKYSFTLHDDCGERLLGFDNAHAVKSSQSFDHRHRFRHLGSIRSYEYRGGAQLLSDFYAAAEGACRLEGIAFEFGEIEKLGDLPLEDDDGT
jgi:Family of unknown function (DUF6516)